jgi:hypothetical protein
MTDCPDASNCSTEIREMEAPLAEWQARRTTGGPTGDYTCAWRNLVLPRVETAAPDDDKGGAP